LLAVHLTGTFNVTKAAWPHMIGQQYGRIVFTSSSSGMFGIKLQSAYAAAKAGVVGLMNVLALEGAQHGVLCNALMPNANGRMADEFARSMAPEELERAGAMNEVIQNSMQPGFNTGLAVYLASEACTSTHSIYSQCAGRIARVFVGVTPGWQGSREHPASAEEVAAHIEHFEIVDINHGTCTKIRLRLDLDAVGQRSGLPNTVILKGGFEPHSRAMHGTHEKEVHGYRDMLEVLGLRSPTCYFAEYDPARLQGIIIMEDLVARGVHFCHPLIPQTHEQVAARLSVLAAFHARTWASPGFAGGGQWDWSTDIMPAMRLYMAHYLQPDIWRQFIQSPRGAAASVRFHDRHWMNHAIDKMNRLSQRLPPCLVHGDTHLGNLYIDIDGTPGFFDPQALRAPALAEVAYHIAGALDPADRRRSDGPLLQHYLDELGRNGIEPPRFEDALRDYGALLALGYGIFITNESAYQSEAINTAYTARFSAAMLDHDTVGLLDAIA
jgi:short chain dehydrogenase/Phosphotransferase enzyme family